MEELQKQLTEALSKLTKAEADLTVEKVRADKAEADLAVEKAARKDSETEAVARMRVERDQADARADTLQRQLDTVKGENVAAQKAIKEDVRSRVKLESKAREILDAADAQKLDEMDDRAIKIAVIKRVDGDQVDISTSKSNEYVDARYDAAVARADSASVSFSGARRLFGSGHADTGGENDAKRRMEERNRNAWKN